MRYGVLIGQSSSDFRQVQAPAQITSHWMLRVLRALAALSSRLRMNS